MGVRLGGVPPSTYGKRASSNLLFSISFAFQVYLLMLFQRGRYNAYPSDAAIVSAPLDLLTPLGLILDPGQHRKRVMGSLMAFALTGPVGKLLLFVSACLAAAFFHGAGTRAWPEDPSQQRVYLAWFLCIALGGWFQWYLMRLTCPPLDAVEATPNPAIDKADS